MKDLYILNGYKSFISEHLKGIINIHTLESRENLDGRLREINIEDLETLRKNLRTPFLIKDNESSEPQSVTLFQFEEIISNINSGIVYEGACKRIDDLHEIIHEKLDTVFLDLISKVIKDYEVQNYTPLKTSEEIKENLMISLKRLPLNTLLQTEEIKALLRRQLSIDGVYKLRD